ncbi:MAG TPA: phosphoglycerate kinase [Chloroflexota bacterium]
MNKKTVRDVDVRGKRVLVRVDFNVPLDPLGNVADDTRIREALPTIEYLKGQGAKVVLMSHLGRPKGNVVESLRMAPVARELERLLGQEVETVPDCVGPEVEEAVRRMQPGTVLLLENLRFHPEEEANDPEFARRLAALGDLFVNDAFGTAHRAHASTVGVARYLPAVAGLLMERELTTLSRLLEQPERPFAAIIGGAKVSGKLEVLRKLLEKVDVLVVGGGMANTFLLAQGCEVGKSLVEPELVGEARAVIEDARRRGVRLVLPEDVVVADRVDPEAQTSVVSVRDVPHDRMIVDIGPRTVQAIAEALAPARTIFWNGPMGIFEVPPFAVGTKRVAEIVARSTAITVIGGGDTIAAVQQLGLADRITHISTGGGATLEFLEGKTLPGVAVLQERE